MRTELLRFNGAVVRDPTIDAWMKEHAGELGAIANQWFEVMRKCGDEVRELLHGGCPVAGLGALLSKLGAERPQLDRPSPWFQRTGRPDLKSRLPRPIRCCPN